MIEIIALKTFWATNYPGFEEGKIYYVPEAIGEDLITRGMAKRTEPKEIEIEITKPRTKKA